MKDPLIDQTENEKESRGTPKHDAERNKLISLKKMDETGEYDELPGSASKLANVSKSYEHMNRFT